MSKKLNVLTILDRLIPSNVIGIIKPMMTLQNSGHINFSMRYTWFYSEQDIRNCDVLVLCRNINPKDLRLVELAKKHGKAIIFDIDDNFFELPISTPIGRYHRTPVHLYVVSEMIKSADAVRVYSAPMMEISGQLNPNTYQLKSYFDFTLLKGVEPKKHLPIKIVYATSRISADDFLASTYIPALIRILEEYGDRVEFYSFGTLPHQLQNLPNAKKLPYQHNYNSFIKSFYQEAFDIGLAPLLDDVVHNSKTNNKFREYGAMGVCGIYSNAKIYRDCVVHAENGMLTENTPEDWYQAIRTLIESKTLREQIAVRAQRDVRENYSFESTLENWMNILEVAHNNSSTADYFNIMNLKLLIVMDDFFVPTIDLRFDSLASLIGNAGIYNDRIKIHEATPEMLRLYDVVIYFPENNSQTDVSIEYLSSLCKHLIVDTLLPVEHEKMHTNVVFTNQLGSVNSETIPSTYYKEELDLLAKSYEHIMISGQNADISEVILSAYQKKQQMSEKYYSQQSSVFLWANVLHNYKGSLQPVSSSFPRKILNLFFKPFKKLARKLVKVLRPYFSRIKRVQRKLSILYVVFTDYFKINVKKKY